MSENNGSYQVAVLSKINRVVEKGLKIIQQIPQLIKQTQSNKISEDILSSIEVDKRFQKRRYGTTQVLEMTGVSHTKLYAAEKDGRLPAPDFREDTKSKQRAGYTINQINNIRQFFNTAPKKPDGYKAAIVGFLNLKGGSQKTTHCHLFSQYLAIQGYKVLILDTDPQGSLSFFYGKRPDIDVFFEQTFAPYLLEDDESLCSYVLSPEQKANLRYYSEMEQNTFPEGSVSNLRYAVQKTYWDQIDIIPSCLENLNIDLVMPKIMDNLNTSFEDRISKLRRGLLDVADDYDFIIIDGTPSLNLTTLNVVSACDMVFVPTPAAMADFASTLQFTSLIADTLTTYVESGLEPNVPDIRYFITKFSNSSSSAIMAQFIRKIFEEEKGDVMANMSYQSNEVGKSTNSIESIYEVNPSETSNRKGLQSTIGRFDALFEEILDAIIDTCFTDTEEFSEELNSLIDTNIESI